MTDINALDRYKNFNKLMQSAIDRRNKHAATLKRILPEKDYQEFRRFNHGFLFNLDMFNPYRIFGLPDVLERNYLSGEVQDLENLTDEQKLELLDKARLRPWDIFTVRNNVNGTKNFYSNHLQVEGIKGKSEGNLHFTPFNAHNLEELQELMPDGLSYKFPMFLLIKATEHLVDAYDNKLIDTYKIKGVTNSVFTRFVKRWNIYPIYSDGEINVFETNIDEIRKAINQAKELPSFNSVMRENMSLLNDANKYVKTFLQELGETQKAVSFWDWYMDRKFEESKTTHT